MTITLSLGYLCALPLEAAAAKVMLDKIHPQLPQPAGDDNAYTLGEIFGHTVSQFHTYQALESLSPYWCPFKNIQKIQILLHCQTVVCY